MKQNLPPIYFHYESGPFFFPERTLLKCFVAELIKREKRALEQINFIFCSDEYLLHINRQYLNHSTYTDIITFELSSKGAPIISDIYISIDRVRENADSFKTSFISELRRVMFHGALHLCGFKDKTKQDRKLMREKEEEYLSLYEVSRET